MTPLTKPDVPARMSECAAALGSTDPRPMLERITHTDKLAPVTAQQWQIAQIVAQESAETVVGRSAGLRVEVVRWLMGPVANRVAERFVTNDRALGEDGMRHGSAWIVDDATGGLAVEGGERIPVRGPLLVVANHPGLSDAVALLAALGREDAWIVTVNYPFLRAMRLASRRFLFVSDDRADRLSAFRSIVAAPRWEHRPGLPLRWPRARSGAVARCGARVPRDVVPQHRAPRAVGRRHAPDPSRRPRRRVALRIRSSIGQAPRRSQRASTHGDIATAWTPGI